MTTFAKILTGAAGLAMVAGAAAPAAAQYAPYGGYNQGYNTIGGVIDSVLGGGRYGAYGQGNMLKHRIPNLIFKEAFEEVMAD
jgi:hypothetical protein